jgi:hypothetical protein
LWDYPFKVFSDKQTLDRIQKKLGSAILYFTI